MTGLSYFESSPELTEEQVREMMLGLFSPEYNSREKVLEYVRQKLVTAIFSHEGRLEDLLNCSMIYYDEAKQQLEGTNPLTSDVYHELVSRLGIVDSGLVLFPYDQNIPESRYKEIYEKIFSVKPDIEEPSGMLSIFIPNFFLHKGAINLSKAFVSA